MFTGLRHCLVLGVLLLAQRHMGPRLFDYPYRCAGLCMLDRSSIFDAIAMSSKVRVPNHPRVAFSFIHQIMVCGFTSCVRTYKHHWVSHLVLGLCLGRIWTGCCMQVRMVVARLYQSRGSSRYYCKSCGDCFFSRWLPSVLFSLHLLFRMERTSAQTAKGRRMGKMGRS
jgi:hypothetical protein